MPLKNLNLTFSTNLSLLTIFSTHLLAVRSFVIKVCLKTTETHVILILTLFYGKMKPFMKILFQTLSLLCMQLKGIEL